MQEFLLNNTVSCNLMSLTGYRTLVLLSMLMDSPKSADEINNYFISHPHIKEKFSKDTLRIYMNSLRAIGCKISRANKSNGNKYELLSHPFGLEISKSQLKALSRLYENIYDKLELENLLAVESLLEKISLYVQDEKVRDYLKNISILKNINKKLLKELMFHCSQNHQISFLYNSPNSKEKNIKIIAQKIAVKSSKVYLCG